MYPFEQTLPTVTTVSYGVNRQGQIIRSSNQVPSLSVELQEYISYIPIPKKEISSADNQYFQYFIQRNPNSYTRCFGDTEIPDYLILINSNIKGFEDWPRSETIRNGTRRVVAGADVPRCFSKY